MNPRTFRSLCVVAALCIGAGYASAQLVDEVVAPKTDTAPPQFTSIGVAGTEDTSATIVWTTDEPAFGFVEYGTTENYGAATPISGSALLSHTVTLSNLAPETRYYFRIVARDASGNTAYSENRTAETAAAFVAADAVPPEITNISVDNVTTAGANISWATDELAQGSIEYGTTASYGSATEFSDAYETAHTVSLSSLTADTPYHFRVIVRDEAGNEAVSPDEIFTTAAPAPPPPSESEPEPEPALAISGVETASVGTTTATIVWNTNTLATGVVRYGTSEALASSSPVSSAYATAHRIALSGLTAGTNYFYAVSSQSETGATAERSNFEFTTLYTPVAVAPKPTISNLAVTNIGTSGATVQWNTQIPTTGEVRYGTTSAYGQKSVNSDTQATAHARSLAGLLSGTRYHFVAVSRSADGSEVISADRTFTTAAAVSAPAVSVTEDESDEDAGETIIDDTTAPEEEGLTGGHGGKFSFTPTTVIAKPALTKVQALDRQVMFVWKPAALSPAPTRGGRTNVLIVRSRITYPSDPTAGKIVYKGNSGLFADTAVKNDRAYYYSLFTANQFNSYSVPPARFKVSPAAAAPHEVTLATVPPLVQKTPVYSFSKTLAAGDTGTQVEHLQVLLASEPALYPEGYITGYFGRLTEQAVRAFQTRYQLPLTGRADAPTLRKLETLSAAPVAHDAAERYERAFRKILKEGGKGEGVRLLQRFLIRAGAYPEALETGYFGALTRSAVARFQQVQNITPAEGYVGTLTKQRIINLVRLRAVSF